MDLLGDNCQKRKNAHTTHSETFGRFRKREEKALLLAWMSTPKTKSSKMDLFIMLKEDRTKFLWKTKFLLYSLFYWVFHNKLEVSKNILDFPKHSGIPKTFGNCNNFWELCNI